VISISRMFLAWTYTIAVTPTGDGSPPDVYN